jgi:peptide/nickel transport system ATP-binding protein
MSAPTRDEPVGPRDVVLPSPASRPDRVEPVLSVEDLNVWFSLPDGGEVHAVRGVSLDLRPGERLGLVGESGCGKTTTILALMGLLPPNASLSGRVLLDGSDMAAQGEASFAAHRWCDVAMVFQGAMNAFNPVKTIGAQIVEPMELHGCHSGRAARLRARELVELVGLRAAIVDRYPHELSGGMRQRAVIAMALACGPKVLLADEPTTALDVVVQAQILEMLIKLSEDLGLALVMVTHDLGVVAQTCSRAAVMYAGEICEDGDVETMYGSPRHPYTGMLFAATPDLARDDAVASIPGAPPRLDQVLQGCPFAARCPHAFAPCGEVHPALVALGPGHRAACHLNDPAYAGRAA